MNLFGMLRSVEEMLYEIITRPAFYPRTFWRIALHPQQMSHHSDSEPSDEISDPYYAGAKVIAHAYVTSTGSV